jgi:hypothetical protein
MGTSLTTAAILGAIALYATGLWPSAAIAAAFGLLLGWLIDYSLLMLGDFLRR